MYDPIVPPNLGWHFVKQSVGWRVSRNLAGNKRASQGFDINHEGIACPPPGLPTGGQATGRYQVMDTNIIAQVASPGVQHSDHVELDLSGRVIYKSGGQG